MRQPFMLRIRLQRCQGVLSHGRVARLRTRRVHAQFRWCKWKSTKWNC